MAIGSRFRRCLFLPGLAAGSLAAQQAGPPAPTRFTMWATAAPLAPGRALAALALTAQVNQVVLSTRLATWDDPCDASDCWPNGDVGVLAGYGMRAGGKWHIYAAAGLAQGFDDNSNFLAFPLQAEVSWRPFSFLGIGLMGYASVGTGEDQGSSQPDARSFGGVSLALQLGKVR
ncbi:MAG TPA: hypothetical protein VF862_01125 [Gemmatimonadales bacterium]